jgi:hypothetical protein
LHASPMVISHLEDEEFVKKVAVDHL